MVLLLHMSLRGEEAPRGTFERFHRAGRGQLRGGCKCPKEFSRRPAMDSRPSANLKTYRPPKEIPRRGPPGIPYLQYCTRKSGACAGKGLAGGGLEGCASPQEANPSKVFSHGGNLIRRGHPRSSPMVRIFTSGGARDRERKFCKVLRGILQIPVDKSAVLRYNNTQACGARRSGRGSVSQALRGRRGEDFHRPRLAGRRGRIFTGRVLRDGRGGFSPVASCGAAG